MLSTIVFFLSHLTADLTINYQQGFESFPGLSVSGVKHADLSPDDEYLYLTNEADDELKVFSYDKDTGYLAEIQTIVNADTGNQFNFVQGIKAAPNGQWVYTINQADKLIMKFDRNPDGTLIYDPLADTALPSGAVGQRLLIASNSADLYIGTRINGSLFHYKITPGTGLLTLQNTYADGDMSGGSTITTLIGTDGYWLDDNENFLYVTTFNGASVLVFSRAANGDLTFVQKAENNFGGISGMVQSTYVTGVTDGSDSFLVVMGRENSTTRLFAFSRNTSTGLLTYLGRFSSGSGIIIGNSATGKVHYCQNSTTAWVYQLSATDPDPISVLDTESTTGATGCGGAALSADGATFLRVANFQSAGSDSLVSYAVSASGHISQLLNYPPARLANMERPTSLTSANNSPHVYLTSSVSNSINTFFRENDGTLTHMSSFVYVDEPGSGLDGLTSIFDLAISADGDHAYTAAFGDNGIGFFNRNNNPGSALYSLLTYQDIYQTGVNGITGLDGAYHLRFSNDPDQDYLYATSVVDNAVAVFSRNMDGSLNQLQTITNATHSGTLSQPAEIHLNEDNSLAWVASYAGDSVFEYDVSGGQLTYAKTLDDAYFGVSDDTFGQPSSIAVLSDAQNGLHDSFYVYSAVTQKITYVERDENTGQYTLGPQLVNPAFGSGICVLKLSPDNRFLHISCRSSDSVRTYLIRPDYSLAMVRVYQQLDWNQVIGMDQPGVPKYSWDGEYLYIPGSMSDGFTVHQRIDDFIYASGYEQ